MFALDGDDVLKLLGALFGTITAVAGAMAAYYHYRRVREERSNRFPDDPAPVAAPTPDGEPFGPEPAEQDPPVDAADQSWRSDATLEPPPVVQGSRAAGWYRRAAHVEQRNEWNHATRPHPAPEVHASPTDNTAWWRQRTAPVEETADLVVRSEGRR